MSQNCTFWQSLDEFKPAVSLDEEGYALYVVEDIVGKKEVKRNGKICFFYFVKWLGWPSNYNTWEPVDNLLNSEVKELIDNYEVKLKKTERENIFEDPQIFLQNDSRGEEKQNGNLNKQKKDSEPKDEFLMYLEDTISRYKSESIQEKEKKNELQSLNLNPKEERHEESKNIPDFENNKLVIKNLSEFPKHHKIIQERRKEKEFPHKNNSSNNTKESISKNGNSNNRELKPAKNHNSESFEIKNTVRIHQLHFQAPLKRKPDPRLQIPNEEPTKRRKFMAIEEEDNTNALKDPRLKPNKIPFPEISKVPLPKFVTFQLENAKARNSVEKEEGELAFENEEELLDSNISEKQKEILKEILKGFRKKKKVEISIDTNEPFEFNPSYSFAADFDGSFYFDEMNESSRFITRMYSSH